MVTILLDIIHISIFYPRASLSDTERFSAGMAIVSALLKPASCFFVYQMYRERRGELLLRVGEASASGRLPDSPLAGPGAGTLPSLHLSPVSALPAPQPRPQGANLAP